MVQRITRRRFLRAGGVASVLVLAGCSQVSVETPPGETKAPPNYTDAAAGATPTATETTETPPPTQTQTATPTPNDVADGFESGAYDDGDPVTWQVESPGAYVNVQRGTVKNGEYALEMKSGQANENHAKLYHHADGATIRDGDVFSAWMRTDGRVFYRLSTQPSGGGPHSIQAGIVTDHDRLKIQTSDQNGETIVKSSFGTPDTGQWYLFEMEMYPSQSELIGRVYDSSQTLISEQTLATSGATGLEYTTLHVPTPFGRQDTGWFDDVSVRSSPKADQESSEADQEGEAGVDGFEDGDISEYSGQVGGFQVQQSVVKNGGWALKGQVQSGDNQAIHRGVSVSQPSRVQGYVRVGHGGGNENAHLMYHADGPDGPRPIHVDFSMNHGNDGFGDTSGDPNLLVNGQEVMDVKYTEWYFVELEQIDWGGESVGKVSVDGSVKAENVAFRESAASVDTLVLRVNDWGDESAWFDDVSI